jgi:REP element-mobilizing transposase RayT
MRAWLLTSTTYGTWLPGDARGFVGRVTDVRAGDGTPTARVEHDEFGTEYDRDIRGLRESARDHMTGEPVWLTVEQAAVVAADIRSSAAFRQWELTTVAVMANHFHVVIRAPAAVLTDKIFQVLKSYSSRALNKRWPKPASGTWWTASGSRRPLKDDHAVEFATRYVLNQHAPLAVWSAQETT